VSVEADAGLRATVELVQSQLTKAGSVANKPDNRSSMLVD